MGKHGLLAGDGPGQPAKRLKAKDSVYFAQSAKIHLAPREALCNILQRLHSPPGAPFNETALPSHKLPSVGPADVDYYASGAVADIAAVIDHRDAAPRPSWLPQRAWRQTVQDIAGVISKIGRREWLADSEIQAVIHYTSSHRWDLTPRLAFEPFAGYIASSTDNTDLSKKLPR
ncbi:hypothetical protein BJ166DRAFT_514991 [Pestalotiopsis sp. NC0098]|nr:hypothetical protein BJ166DRAFT_514991 [Pestalotiopsis sp. NC0098]